MRLMKFSTGLIACVALAGLASCGGGGSAPTYTVGGTIAGSVGTVVLQINGAGDISMANPGAFTFGAGLANGATYTVTANGAQNCNVANGSGTMGATNIGNVTVTCTSVVRSANLSSAQENPPNGSTATGRGSVIVNPTTREITGGITFAGIAATAHHIHRGDTTVVVGLTAAAGGGVATVPSGTNLSPADYAELVAGTLYFNVHSTAFPGGEIRGQINTRTGITAGLASLSGAQEVPANASVATGRGTIVFDSTTRDILIAYVTHNVVGANNAHIHTGVPGLSGPPNVVNPMTPGTNVYTAPNPATLTAQNVTDLTAGNTYFNVHSATYPGGEIRGQIAVQ